MQGTFPLQRWMEMLGPWGGLSGLGKGDCPNLHPKCTQGASKVHTEKRPPLGDPARENAWLTLQMGCKTPTRRPRNQSIGNQDLRLGPSSVLRHRLKNGPGCGMGGAVLTPRSINHGADGSCRAPFTNSAHAGALSCWVREG